MRVRAIAGKSWRLARVTEAQARENDDAPVGCGRSFFQHGCVSGDERKLRAGWLVFGYFRVGENRSIVAHGLVSRVAVGGVRTRAFGGVKTGRFSVTFGTFSDLLGRLS